MKGIGHRRNAANLSIGSCCPAAGLRGPAPARTVHQVSLHGGEHLTLEITDLIRKVENATLREERHLEFAERLSVQADLDRAALRDDAMVFF